MSASTTHHPRNRTWSTARTACAALRLGRNPYDWFWKFASKTGSITIRHACWTIRSRTVGIPRGRWRPSGLGMYTRSTGWGWYLPAFRSAASTSRNSATPCRSTSSRLTPSTPALPPLVFTSCQARHSTSGRSMRSYRAWNLRFRHFLAARYSLRWSCRDFSFGWSWPLPACIVTYLPAGHDKSRGPLLRLGCVVPVLSGSMASSDFSVGVGLHFALRFIADLTIGVGYRPPEISLVSCNHFDDIPLPIRRGVLRGCIPDSSPLPWPSPVSEWFGSPSSACRRCRIPFMVRTAILHLFLRGILQLPHLQSPRA